MKCYHRTAVRIALATGAGGRGTSAAYIDCWLDHVVKIHAQNLRGSELARRENAAWSIGAISRLMRRTVTVRSDRRKP